MIRVLRRHGTRIRAIVSETDGCKKNVCPSISPGPLRTPDWSSTLGGTNTTMQYLKAHSAVWRPSSMHSD